MASDKKGLTDKDVEIFLCTPLFRFRYLVNEVEEELLENTVRISGKVLAENEGGLLVDAKAISNMKTVEKKFPFKEIFLPYSKIDFMVVTK